MSRLSTKHAVLGLMIERPAYGYGLQREVASRLGFLGLADSAVYKTLERLHGDGWVAAVGGRGLPSEPPRARRILYEATPAGVDAFRAWMAAPSERGVLRDELHAKLVLSTPDDLPALRGVVARQAAECLTELARLRRAPLTAEAARLPWSEAALLMVDDFKARLLEGQLGWLKGVGQLIEDRIAAGEGPPARRRDDSRREGA